MLACRRASKLERSTCLLAEGIFVISYSGPCYQMLGWTDFFLSSYRLCLLLRFYCRHVGVWPLATALPTALSYVSTLAAWVCRRWPPPLFSPRGCTPASHRLALYISIDKQREQTYLGCTVLHLQVLLQFQGERFHLALVKLRQILCRNRGYKIR